VHHDDIVADYLLTNDPARLEKRLPQIRQVILDATGKVADDKALMTVTSIPLIFPISVYGGYFGAGAGTLLLGALTLATEGDYRTANVTKNLVSSLNTVAASAWFISHGAVSWPQTLVMMIGCLVGGFSGAHLARRVPQQLMRWVVVLVGLALTVLFAWRYWF